MSATTGTWPDPLAGPPVGAGLAGRSLTTLLSWELVTAGSAATVSMIAKILSVCAISGRIAVPENKPASIF
ncbi:hypothetical protein [Frankia sp. CiP3]|uniref:hypothetical protein n=1 Tax=Frankia sp. CiP3 TaxID=2880971 RepID=UPI001EF40A56|nr:hypothetical protein [Frankia sp. CiP3]